MCKPSLTSIPANTKCPDDLQICVKTEVNDIDFQFSEDGEMYLLVDFKNYLPVIDPKDENAEETFEFFNRGCYELYVRLAY